MSPDSSSVGASRCCGVPSPHGHVGGGRRRLDRRPSNTRGQRAPQSKNREASHPRKNTHKSRNCRPTRAASPPRSPKVLWPHPREAGRSPAAGAPAAAAHNLPPQGVAAQVAASWPRGVPLPHVADNQPSAGTTRAAALVAVDATAAPPVAAMAAPWVAAPAAETVVERPAGGRRRAPPPSADPLPPAPTLAPTTARCSHPGRRGQPAAGHPRSHSCRSRSSAAGCYRCDRQVATRGRPATAVGIAGGGPGNG